MVVTVPTETPAVEALSFEEAYRELEATVERLDTARGELTLEDVIALYERGMRLAQHCSQALDSAELQVHQLHAAHDKQPER